MGTQMPVGYNNELDGKITKDSFERINVIGRGGFGRVYKVYYKKHNVYYALKEMYKAKIFEKKSVKSVKYERDLLSKMHHPFIVNMHYAFQCSENLYIIMDLLEGGDLRFHLNNYKRFSEDQTRFFMGCMVLGLEYCHANKIIHRDIKPENVVLDMNGYAKITDFGIAKIWEKDNAKEGSGTPGYMAPEVMVGKNHSFAVDYFALGVMAYEFMKGVRPYVGKQVRDIKDLMCSKQIEIKKNEIPDGWSLEAAAFINKLIQRKESSRLGSRGAGEVKENTWFKYYTWKDLYLQRIKSPFIPPKSENYKKSYCEARDRESAKTKEKYFEIMSSSKIHTAFKDFTNFDRWSHERQKQKELIANTYEEFINPHKVYLEVIKGNNNSNDASIINRNILKKKILEESQNNDKNQVSKIGMFQPSSLIQAYSSFPKSKKTGILNMSKGLNSSSSFRGNDLSHMSCNSKRNLSYTKGHKYNF